MQFYPFLREIVAPHSDAGMFAIAQVSPCTCQSKALHILMIVTDSLSVDPELTLCFWLCFCSAPSRVCTGGPLSPAEPLPQHRLQLQLAAAVGPAGLHLRPLPHAGLVPVSDLRQAGQHAHPVRGGKRLFVNRQDTCVNTAENLPVLMCCVYICLK